METGVGVGLARGREQRRHAVKWRREDEMCRGGEPSWRAGAQRKRSELMERLREIERGIWIEI
jgi:hypothetical protein